MTSFTGKQRVVVHVIPMCCFMKWLQKICPHIFGNKGQIFINKYLMAYLAFDKIDHSLLYDCLLDWFGIDGTVMLWIKSYLSTRKQNIKIGDSFSEAVILSFRVLQGSVLGLLLFIIYTSPLKTVTSKFNVTHHLYADDTKIYLAVDSRNFNSSMEELTGCQYRSGWMVLN